MNVAARVQVGAQLLDQALPGWLNHIDIDVLDIGTTRVCMLGQLFRDGSEDYYREGLVRLGIDEQKAITCGFAEEGGADVDNRQAYQELTCAWMDLIQARRMLAAA